MEQWRRAMGKQNWREPGLTVTFSGGLAEALDASPPRCLPRRTPPSIAPSRKGRTASLA